MGLDMFIFKMPRFENATYRDVVAVESYLDLQEYKKEHPECKDTMKQWCGMAKPADKIIRHYKPLYKDGHIATEAAYWRKANAIHKWFVDHVQDGEDDCDIHREVTKKDLLELLGLCNTVKMNPKYAEDLLPTQPGFFFGGTEYDDFYMEDIDSTIRQLRDIIDNTDFENEMLFYVSSW